MRKFLSEECGLIFTDSQNIDMLYAPLGNMIDIFRTLQSKIKWDFSLVNFSNTHNKNVLFLFQDFPSHFDTFYACFKKKNLSLFL